MNEITHITQTENSTRIFCAGNHLSFIEDWNKTLNIADGKQPEKDKENK